MRLDAEYNGKRHINTLYLEKHEGYYLAKFKELVKEVEKESKIKQQLVTSRPSLHSVLPNPREKLMLTELITDLFIPFIEEKIKLEPTKGSYVDSSFFYDSPHVTIKCEEKDFLSVENGMRLIPEVVFKYDKDNNKKLIIDLLLQIDELRLLSDKETWERGCKTNFSYEFEVVLDGVKILLNKKRAVDKSEIIFYRMNEPYLSVFPVTEVNKGLNLIDKIFKLFMERKDVLEKLESIWYEMRGRKTSWDKRLNEEYRPIREALEIGYSVKLAQTLEELLNSTKVELK